MHLKARPESVAEDPRFATGKEARDAIQNFGKSDLDKLMAIARGFARNRLRGAAVDPEDLLQDAIVKTLDGRRRWSCRVSIIKHLDRVMESDSSHVAEQRAAHGSDQLSDANIEPTAQEPSHEARFQAREALDAVTALFANDDDAFRLIRLKANGFSASEIRSRFGIDKKQYETVTKRIRRRLATFLTEGGGNDHGIQRP